MKLYEYQAKELFAESGIGVPNSVIYEIGTKPEGGLEARISSVGFPNVLKAQVLQGGRGKAGLIKITQNIQNANIILNDFRNRNVHKVLIEEAVSIRKEMYLSITIDAPSGKVLIIACTEGGVEIEELALTQPEKIIRQHVDIRLGLSPFLARDIAFRLDEEMGKEISSVLLKMYSIFMKKDAEFVEINPLFITSAGEIIAGDGKISIDDNSAFRQTEFKPGPDYYKSEAEYEAAEEGIPYLQFDGDISLMCAGAGLTTTVYDLINYEGGSIANYLEFGGPNYRRAQRAMELCLKNDSKVILVVTFGTIARADVMAEGIVTAIKNLNPDRPIVVCIRGTNEEEAVRILEGAGLEPLFDTEEAVRKAVLLCREATG